MLIKRLYVFKYILFYLNPNEAEKIEIYTWGSNFIRVNNYSRLHVHRNLNS